MLKRSMLLIAGLACVAAYAAFGLLSSAPPQDEISSADALTKRNAFVQAAGLPAEPSKPKASILYNPSGWEVRDPSYYLRLDREGNVISFRNDRGGARTGKKRFATKAEAEAYVRMLAKALGVPTNWKLKKLEMANTKGEVMAGFAEPLPGGHNVLEGPVRGEPIGINAATLWLDPQDGMLRRWSFGTGAIADPPNLRIQRADAIKRAQQAYSNFYSKRRSFHGGPLNPAGVKLGYAYEPGAMEHVGAHARLVWSVPFGDEPVLVDVETGSAVVMALK
jgi:hypothetical protein